MEPCRWHVPDTGPSGPDAVPAARPGPLWLAVHLPWLSGEVAADGSAGHLVICTESARGRVVHRASPAARALGLCPGMTVSAANVLCPGLQVQPRNPGREARRLAEIGEAMLGFSPVVALSVPETVLVEVRGSLKLFGGLEHLKSLMIRRIEAAGHVCRIAGAPTPLAAEYLVHWGRDLVVMEKSALRSALGAMPVGLLRLDGKTAVRLERAGIRRLRDLWRLPADGLGRRFGARLVRELARLRGDHPDPRPRHEPAPRFSAHLTLDWATDDLAQIARGVDHLLARWVDYLRRSAGATTGFSIECLPEGKGGATRLDIGVRHASRDLDHLRRLAAERLSRARLPGPVTALMLRSDCIHRLAARNGELFAPDEAAGTQWRRTEELLAARLGGEGLAVPGMVAEHRPEHAWHLTPDGGSPGSTSSGLRRPLWLLQPPRPLPRGWKSRDRRESGLIAGPERIESGWWDRRDQRRDYYVATDRRGRRLWVFRDLKRGRWYLHGLFA